MSDITEQFHELPSNEQENLLDTATEWLVERGHLPLSEEAWTDDKYADRIYEKALDLLEEAKNAPKA
jgi:hypothetical protein